MSNITGEALTLASWNVRGLGHVIKRSRVFAHLKSLKAGIIFLQETHLSITHQCRLRTNWISQVYQASFNAKARGVAILFRKNVPFRLSSMVTDPQGRYIMVYGHINAFPITLLNIYGPNFDDSDFFHKIFTLYSLLF